MRRTSRREAIARFTATVFGVEGAKAAAGASLSYSGHSVQLTLAALGNRTLRISLTPAEGGHNQSIPPDPVIIRRSPQARLLQTNAITSSTTLRWGSNRIQVSPNPFSIAIDDSRGRNIQKFEFSSEGGAFNFRTGAQPLFGMGEGGPQYDRLNHEYTMRNGQYNPDQRIEGGRVPIPWIFSPEGWGIFIHQPYGITSLMNGEGKFTAAQSAVLPVDIFLLVGPEPAQVLREYAELTGYPHLPPLWSLGYQQSHRTLDSREEVLSEAREFRSKKLPCDTMIYLGTGFSPSGWNTGHGSFHFNEKVFPDPDKMIEELHREHFHVVLHLTQPPEQLHGSVHDVGTAANSDVNHVAPYWSTHLSVFRLGVDGWWPDEGDKLSPESRLARDRLYWEGPLKDRPNVRPFTLNRNGYAGLQRYGWLWTGDVNSDWRALAAQVPVGINTGLTGMPYWGTDTGGFIPTREFTGELYVRWFQYSAFCPLFRSHGRNWKMHLPWGWNTGDYGPIETDPANLTDPSNLHNPEVERICRKYLDLRYQLLPYLYSTVRESHETGLPIIRAMWLHYPDDPETVARGDQYLWGRDILIAPITAPGVSTRNVYLPKAGWYDFWNGERVSGGRQVNRQVDLETIPVYVRAGTILPIGPVKQYVAESKSELLSIQIYPGADGRFVLYDDDGVSLDYQRGAFMRLIMTWNDSRRELKLELAPGSGLFGGAVRQLDVKLSNEDGGKQVRFEGKSLVVRL